MKNEKDWTVADKDGNINVPDRLDNLLNRIGFQVRLITVSGLNEIECLARMVKGADEHSRKEAIKFAYWKENAVSKLMHNDVKVKEGYVYCQRVMEKGEEQKFYKTNEELYELYIATAVAVTA